MTLELNKVTAFQGSLKKVTLRESNMLEQQAWGGAGLDGSISGASQDLNCCCC